jgi:predicted lipoprotein with Yx(FWY)xxD motif
VTSYTYSMRGIGGVKIKTSYSPIGLFCFFTFQHNMGTTASRCAKGKADIAAKSTPQARVEDEPEAEGAFCWICHEDGTKKWPGDQPGFQELKRDCSCRGSSGYAHWACLVQYAANKVSEGGDITK